MTTQDGDFAPSFQAAMHSESRRVKAVLFPWFEKYLLACKIAKERKLLGKLGPKRLTDMGISPELARAESRRRFWDLRDVSRFVRR